MDRYIGQSQIIESAADMQALGEELARALRPGDTLLLHGDLGAGKTTLTQGIAQGFGIERPVTSPTFTLVAEYPVDPPINGIERLHHLDLYRLTDPAELDSFGFEDLLATDGAVFVIEWPERAEGLLPPDGVVIEIAPEGVGQRRVLVRRLGASG